MKIAHEIYIKLNVNKQTQLIALYKTSRQSEC